MVASWYKMNNSLASFDHLSPVYRIFVLDMVFQMKRVKKKCIRLANYPIS